MATTYGENTTYILVKDANNIIGFGQLSAASTGMAGKAFLLLSTSGSGEAKAVRLIFDDGNNITGINEAAATTETVAKNSKYFKNGKLVICKNGKKYNANGIEIK